MEDLPGDLPMKFLVDVEVFLNDNGGLKSDDILTNFIVLLKKAKKMVPRCLLLHILNASEKSIQAKFSQSSGWGILTEWLKEAKEECNDSFIREVLTVLKILPVDVGVLKSNNCAKIVKQLAKQTPEQSSIVPPIARELVIKWMAKINESFLIKSKEQEKEKTLSKKSRQNDNLSDEPPLKKRKKDKERKRHDSESNEVHNFKKEKRLSSEEANSKTHTNTSITEKHAVIEKHRKRELTDKEDPDTKQRKRSTVKMLPQRMRTAGIEESAEKSVPTKSRSEVLAAKKEKLEKPVAEVTAPSIESMHQKIKVNVSGSNEQAEQRSPKVRRPSHEIHESNSFMNALNAAVVPTVIRKKKKTSTGSHSTSPTSKSKPELSANKVEAPKVDKPKEEDANSDCSSDSQGPKKSSLAEIGSLITKKSAKKTVSWADEDNLREVRYFELDETERVNVNRMGSMEEMSRKEHLLERQMFSRNAAGQQSGSSDNSGSPYEKGWYRPFVFEGQSCTTELGKNSREFAIQAERERHVLAALYFSKESIPDAAQEPDMVHEDYVEPVIIPLDDQTITESDLSVPDSSEQTKTEEDKSKGSPSSSPNTDANGASASKVLMSTENEFSLTPEVASLLKSITAGLAPSKSEGSEGNKDSSRGDPLNAVPSSDQQHRNQQKPAGMLATPNPNSPSSQQPPYNEKVWRVLRENYPNLNLDEISVDRMRQLLEPIQDQLRACGALNPSAPHQPNSYGMHATGPYGSRNSNGGPHPHHAMHPHPSQGRPPHPGQYGGPNGPSRPMGPVPQQQQKQRFPCYGPQGPRHFGPPMTSHRPPFSNNAPGPHPNGHFKGPDRGMGPSNRICRFFQNGACRSGPNCRFVHSHGGGPSHSPQDS